MAAEMAVVQWQRSDRQCHRAVAGIAAGREQMQLLGGSPALRTVVPLATPVVPSTFTVTMRPGPSNVQHGRFAQFRCGPRCPSPLSYCAISHQCRCSGRMPRWMAARCKCRRIHGSMEQSAALRTSALPARPAWSRPGSTFILRTDEPATNRLPGRWYSPHGVPTWATEPLVCTPSPERSRTILSGQGHGFHRHRHGSRRSCWRNRSHGAAQPGSVRAVPHPD